MRDAFAGARMDYLLPSYALLVMQLALASHRWVLALRLDGYPAKGFNYFLYFSLANLTNISLPGGVAGDFFRVWQTAKDGVTVGAAMNAVLLDRIVALATLGLLVIGSALWHAASGEPGYSTVRVLAVAVAGGIGLAILLAGAAETSLARLSKSRWIRVLHRMSHSIRKLFFNLSFQSSRLLAVALLANSGLVLAALLLARAYGIPLTVVDAFLIFPIVLLISSLPISPGGWGVREGAMALLLAPFGAPIEASVSMSITYGVFVMAACLPAAMVYVAKKALRSMFA